MEEAKAPAKRFRFFFAFGGRSNAGKSRCNAIDGNKET